MKKKYMEPQMVVENFRVDEMIAANCILMESDVLIVQQVTDHWNYGKACASDAHFTGAKAEAYTKLGNLFDDGFDHDGKPETTNQYPFTSDYHEYSQTAHIQSQSICNVDPFDADSSVTFGMGTGFECSADSSVIINSL